MMTSGTKEAPERASVTIHAESQLIIVIESYFGPCFPKLWFWKEMFHGLRSEGFSKHNICAIKCKPKFSDFPDWDR